jgi:hypothetical protein
MSDVSRLLAWFDSGALVRPDATAPNTVALSRAIGSICGVAGISLLPHEQRVTDAIGSTEHLVFVMTDGLGMNLIEQLPEDSFFRTHLTMEMQAVFPSSTAPAVTTLATGCWPAEHAVPGWFTYLPDDSVIATILPFIERFSKRPLAEMGVDVHRALPVPSWLPRFSHDPLCYMPAYITGSVYSNYLSGGQPQVAYKQVADAIAAIAQRIDHATAPTYTYFYVPFIDTAEHEHGPQAKAVNKTLRMVEHNIEALAARLAGKARIVVSADHGLTHVERHNQHEIEDGDPLLDLLRLPPSGEPRVPFFYPNAGREEAFAAAFRARFGVTHALLTIDEIDGLRLLGPDALAPETRRRMGEFMAISATPDAIQHKPDDPMLGYHGGLLSDEMRVPLIVV